MAFATPPAGPTSPRPRTTPASPTSCCRSRFNYEVDLWGRIRRTVNVAKEEAQASAADLATARLSIEAELAMDYFELRSADAQTRLLADTVKDYQEALRITTNRFEGGVVAESDVFQAKTQLQQAIVQQTRYRRAALAVRARHRRPDRPAAGQLLAARGSARCRTAAHPAQPAVAAAGAPPRHCRRRAPHGRSQRAHRHRTRSLLPTLNFGATVGLEFGSLLRNFFTASNIAYALGPTLGQTLYDAGRRRGISEQAYAFFDENSANYRQTTLTAFQQVEDNLAALRILQQEAEQQRQATEAAQGAQRIFNNRYVGGIDTYLQVVTAQNTALTNERNDIDIMRRRMDASVLLIKALGGGWTTAQLPAF